MKKTTKQYSKVLSHESLLILTALGEKIRGVRNYFYSRFSGIKSLQHIDYWYRIRDRLVSEHDPITSILPARYWKITLSEIISNIKANWSIIKRKIRRAIFNNDNITDDVRHFLFTILKNNDILYQYIVKREVPKFAQDKFPNLNHTYLRNLINRYIRRYKNKIPHTNKSNIIYLDSGLYRYVDNTLYISTLTKGKRLAIPMRDGRCFKSNLTLKFDQSKLTLLAPINVKVKSKSINVKGQIIGIDKGYRSLIATDTGQFYGDGYGEFTKPYIDTFTEKQKNRNRFYGLYYRHLDAGNIQKANRIIKHNLGKDKWNRQQLKFKELSKSFINHAINEFIQHENPSEIVKEDLTFISNKKNKLKKIANQLNRWQKGYLDHQLEYKSSLYDIKVTNINAAYTSQVCHKCQHLGLRDRETFTCSNCQTTCHADINAAKTIKYRKTIKEIQLFTPAKQVKEYYLKLMKGEATVA